MAFFTRQDDLRFRRTTWLLSKLQVTGPRGDTTNDNPRSPSAEAVALEQLCSLSNLFVRKHEIVAVIPTATPRQQKLYVAAQVENGPLPCILTLDIVSDTDIIPDTEPPQGLRANVVDVQQLKHVPLRNEAIPTETAFQQHVQNVFSFLKEAASLKQQLRQMKEDDQETTNMSERYTRLKVDLEFYITRTCFEKISTRAGYHCAAAVDRKDQREGGSSKDDFTPLLYPMSSWTVDHVKMAKGCGKPFSTIYQSFLSKEPFSFDMSEIFTDENERAKFDPNMWTDDKWTHPEPLHSDLLRHYAPGEVEQLIWKDLVRTFNLEDIPKEEGFYLTAHGRRAYHQLVTTCIWNALLYLNLLKKHKANVANTLQDDSDIGKLTDEACWALHYLEMLAYRSPILGIHLDWLDKKNPNNKRKSDEVENPTTGDISGEGADVLPSLKAMVLQAPSSRFLVSGGRGAAVLRWLRLITLHHFAIWSLLSTSTVEKLPRLDINLVQTSLPCEDQEMEPLKNYFSGMKNPPNSNDIRLCMEAMERQEGKNVDDFKGTYHCEAILLSLYLLHYEARENAADGFDLSAFCKSVGVAHLLAEAAGNFFPGVVAVSKRCCPVCNQLFHAMHKALGMPYNIIGSHAAYSPCALPPFLPMKYAEMVADTLEKRLEPALEDYITKVRKRQNYDRGSASPAHMPQAEDSEVSRFGLRRYGGFHHYDQAGGPAN